jgi:hypothetical protein
MISALEAGMGLEEFWKATPRVVSLVIEAYWRRRAWAAFHAGYGMTVKDAKLVHLLGRPAQRSTTADDLLARFDRFAASHNRAIGAPPLAN